jgi:Na+/melibiose symporter-like transporter
LPDPKPPSEKLTKIGEKVVSHSRYVAFQMAEATTYFTGKGRSWVLYLRQLFQVGRTRGCYVLWRLIALVESDVSDSQTVSF